MLVLPIIYCARTTDLSRNVIANYKAQWEGALWSGKRANNFPVSKQF